MKLLLLVFFVIGLMGCMSTAQYTPVEQTNLIEVRGVSKTELYDRTRQWFSEYFVSGESVIDYEDKVAGSIIGKGVSGNGTDMIGVIPYYFKYTIRVDIKKEKIRIKTKVTEHYYESDRGNKPFAYVSSELDDSAKSKIEEITNNLELYINKHNTDNNW